MAGLETIDDDTDSSDMLFVKVSQSEAANEEFSQSVMGDEMPSLVFFDDKIPRKFEGTSLH